MTKHFPTRRLPIFKIGPRLLLIAVTIVVAVSIGVLTVSSRSLRKQIETKGKNNRGVKQAEYVPGELLVKFSEASKLGDQHSLIASNREISMRVERLKGHEFIKGLRLVHVAAEDQEITLRALRQRPDVVYAEPNFIRRKDVVPNDPNYPSQWALNNTGQNGGVTGADIKAEQAWAATTGSRSIVVGVVDEGIDITHPDLSANIWVNPGEIAGNGIDDDQNGFIDDVNGWDFLHEDNTVFDYTPAAYPPPDDYNGDFDDHGTHVAGIIGATGNNGIGTVGVNWQVSLMSLKFLGADDGSTSDLIQALGYAKMMKDLWTSSGGTKGANLRVLNNSYGGFNFSQAELDAIVSLAASNVLFVCSAGNVHLNNDLIPHYPSSYNVENVIGVGAMDRRNGVSPFTNFGQSIELSAPGSEILSTTPRDTYFFASGTSMASPQVAGAAALLYVTNPNTSIATMRAALMFNGGQMDDQYSLSGRRLNLLGTQQALAENDTTAPAALSDLHIGFQIGRMVRLEWTAPGDDGTVGRASLYEIRFADTPLTDPAAFDQARTIVRMFPATAGTFEFIPVYIPFRHVSGFFGVRAVDNVGNKSPITSVAVSNDPNFSDPYIVTVGSPAALSTGGTALGLIGDDLFRGYALPWSLDYFHEQFTNVDISTNGALRFTKSDPNAKPIGDFPGELTSISNFNQQYVIAAAWDDLRTDRRPGDDVYVVGPDSANPDRIIFRWQAVTYDTRIGPNTTRGENPVNFEIEIRRDGTIIHRYGDGNQKLVPTVGISAGFDGYLVDSHTSESALKDLTNAAAITYELRLPPAPTLQFTTFQTNPNVIQGEQLVYSAVVANNGPSVAPNTVLDVTFSTGQNFLSCSGSGTCQPSGNTVHVAFGNLAARTQVEVLLRTEVTATLGTVVSANAVLSCSRPDVSTRTLSTSSTVSSDIANAIPFRGASRVSSSASGSNTTAIREGTVWGWGNGATGDGSMARKIYAVPARDLVHITAVSAGTGFALALRDDGTVWSWGNNQNGQLGNGDPNLIQSGAPVRVQGLGSIIAIGAGSDHAVALKADGTVWTWGTNASGQLGYGTTDFLKHATPQTVSGLPAITKIFVGSSYTFVFAANGNSWSWGTNFFGQLADGTTTNRSAPVPTTLPTTVSSIAPGNAHVLALLNDSSILSWGHNLWGQLANGSNDNVAHPTPAIIQGLQAVAIAAGAGHSLALKSDGTVWTWGLNERGQLGNGSADIGNLFPKPPHPTPAQVPGLTNVTDIKGGNQYSVAFVGGGSTSEIKTWGDNAFGTLGDNSLTMRTAPVLVVEDPIVAKPIFDKAEGFVTFPLTVSVACGTPGATIRYTTNGIDPTESDPSVASGATIVLNSQSTLKARAFKSGSPPSVINTALFLGGSGNTGLQLSQSTFTVSEGAGVLNVSITRTGDTSGTSIVDIATSDSDNFTVNCGNVSGNAFARCDFATGVDTLNFAPGESSKTFSIPIIDDALVEGNETFTLTLSNARGAALIAPVIAIITITDNDAANGANPIFTTPFFVRLHYLDFLSREPELGEPWSAVLNNCSDVNNNPACDRVTVSGAFFGSPEFQLKGYYVYRLYKVAFDRLPLYQEIVVDMRAVTGQTPTEVFQKKATFVNNFVQRSEFTNLYNSQTNSGFVVLLMNRYSLESITTPDPAAPDGPNKVTLHWTALANGLNAGTLTRAQVLRAIADSDQVQILEFNKAFVAMQYYGYLRRTPDTAGYNAWLNYLNTHPGDSRTMVNGFVNSQEYWLRFGPVP